MGTSQKLSLTFFRELYARMERENASAEALLDVAKRIAAEEARRDQLLRERRERREGPNKTAKPGSRRELLSDLIHG